MKINIIHILLFLIIICLLYTLLSNCGCNKDGFSVGGQPSQLIEQSDSMVRENILNINNININDYNPANIGTRIYLKSIGNFDSSISTDLPIFYSNSEYYVYSYNGLFYLVQLNEDKGKQFNREITFDLNRYFLLEDPTVDQPRCIPGYYNSSDDCRTYTDEQNCIENLCDWIPPPWELSPCTNRDIVCYNNGIVSGNTPNCSCDCVEGWSGTNCDTLIQPTPCTDSDCNNHGTASGDRPNCSCDCVEGWSGTNCETQSPEYYLLSSIVERENSFDNSEYNFLTQTKFYIDNSLRIYPKNPIMDPTEYYVFYNESYFVLFTINPKSYESIRPTDLNNNYSLSPPTQSCDRNDCNNRGTPTGRDGNNNCICECDEDRFYGNDCSQIYQTCGDTDYNNQNTIIPHICDGFGTLKPDALNIICDTEDCTNELCCNYRNCTDFDCGSGTLKPYPSNRLCLRGECNDYRCCISDDVTENCMDYYYYVLNPTREINKCKDHDFLQSDTPDSECCDYLLQFGDFGCNMDDDRSVQIINDAYSDREYGYVFLEAINKCRSSRTPPSSNPSPSLPAITGSISSIFTPTPSPPRSPPPSPSPSPSPPSSARLSPDEQINNLCDISFDIPESQTSNTYYNMGYSDVGGDSPGRCCRSVQNLYDNHMDVIRNASPEIQSNLFNYGEGCADAEHIDSDNNPSAMNTFNAISCQGIMDDVNCRNGGTLESSPTCRCECPQGPQGYFGENCEKSCQEESNRIVPIINRLFEPGNRDLLNEQQQIEVNSYLDFCQ